MMHPKKENVDPQLASSCYSSLIAPSVVEEIIDTIKFKKVKQRIIEEFVDETKVDSMDVQIVMDDCGISRRGYSNVFKAMKSKLKEKKITTSLLPLPTHMRKSRTELNQTVAEFLGPAFHIQGGFQNKDREVHFNEYNNIFFDLERLEQNMVRFYNISPDEVDSKLIFVLKLDECEILKQKKTERITITLMNRALQKKPLWKNVQQMDKNNSTYFSVQSENNIWWLGSFEVCILSFISFIKIST